MIQKKILIVEDDIAMREIVSHKLASSGFNVLAAEDGKKGFDIFLKEKPSLVLLDLMLPEMDGFTVLKNIRELPDQQLAQTPVIVLSNLWSNQDILRTESLKANAFMVKAYFTTEEILSKISEILTQQNKK